MQGQVHLSLFKKYKAIIIAVFVIIAVIAGFFVYKNFVQKSDFADMELTVPQMIPREWLQGNFGTTNPDDPKVGGIFGDPDNDKLNNYQEYIYNTDPNNADTDGDLYYDGTEVAYGTNPLGEGDRSTGSDLGEGLRRAGVGVTLDEIEEEFGPYLNLEREPMVQNITKNQLNIINDNSKAAMDKYSEGLLTIAAYTELPTTGIMIDSFFLYYSQEQVEEFVTRQGKVVNDLVALPVPSELADFHLVQVQLHDGMFAEGKFALDQIKKDIPLESGNFYPEIQYMSPLDVEYARLRVEAFDKYNLAI